MGIIRGARTANCMGSVIASLDCIIEALRVDVAF